MLGILRPLVHMQHWGPFLLAREGQSVSALYSPWRRHICVLSKGQLSWLKKQSRIAGTLCSSSYWTDNDQRYYTTLPVQARLSAINDGLMLPVHIGIDRIVEILSPIPLLVALPHIGLQAFRCDPSHTSHTNMASSPGLHFIAVLTIAWVGGRPRWSF